MKEITSRSSLNKRGKTGMAIVVNDISVPLKKEKDRFLSDKDKILQETFDRIPKQQQPEALRLLSEFAEKAPHLPVIPLPTSKKEMKAIGIETYTEFKARTGSTNGLECLLHNWSKWLKYSTPTLDRDYMSTAELRGLDVQLYNRIKKQYRASEYHRFIPSLSMLNSQVYKQMSKAKIKETLKNISIISHHTPEK